jgi:hypothetical protein
LVRAGKPVAPMISPRRISSWCPSKASADSALLFVSLVLAHTGNNSSRSGSHDLDLLSVGPEIVEPQLGTLITDSLDSTSKCDLPVSSAQVTFEDASAYRLDILDDISILELALCSVLLDELGDTMRDMEFVGVWILGLVSSQSLDGSVSVLVECLDYQLGLKTTERCS